MRAALLFEGSRDLKIQDVEDLKPLPGHALIEVKMCGICHTDLHIIDGFLKPPAYPHVLGHEIAGIVRSAIPTNSREKTLLEMIQSYDNRVIAHFYVTCGICQYCVSGNENLCYRFQRIGFDLWGCYAEFVRAPIENLVPLPSSLGYEAAVLTDAGATAFRALRKAGANVNNSVLVIGIGGLGSMVVQIAKAMGAHVIAIDKTEDKIRWARSLGADAAFNITDEDLIKKEIREGVDIVVDCAGATKTISTGLRLLKRSGRLILLGYSKESFVETPAMKIVYDELYIMGSRASAKQDLLGVLELAKREKIKPIVTNKYRLDHVNRGIDDLRSGLVLGRAVIDFT